jgi:catecholate siderophore receptor
LPNTPEHNLSLTANMAVGERFSFGGGVYHQSERFADAGNLISADGYVRVDAFAAYEFNPNLALWVNVKNVGDERYITKLRNPHFAVPANGRQAIVSLTARY